MKVQIPDSELEYYASGFGPGLFSGHYQAPTRNSNNAMNIRVVRVRPVLQNRFQILDVDSHFNSLQLFSTPPGQSDPFSGSWLELTALLMSEYSRIWLTWTPWIPLIARRPYGHASSEPGESARKLPY